MGQIKVTKAPIERLYVIEPTVHGDSRGYFIETYNQNDMHEASLCQGLDPGPPHHATSRNQH